MSNEIHQSTVLSRKELHLHRLYPAVFDCPTFANSWTLLCD
nr:MAG TPA: hypothetical protein [Caudoviricetes sp.]